MADEGMDVDVSWWWLTMSNGDPSFLHGALLSPGPGLEASNGCGDPKLRCPWGEAGSPADAPDDVPITGIGKPSATAESTKPPAIFHIAEV